MNKYVYSVQEDCQYPEIVSIMAYSYNDAFNRLIQSLGNHYEDDDNFFDLEDIDDLKEYLDTNYSIVISDLYDVDDVESWF